MHVCDRCGFKAKRPSAFHICAPVEPPAPPARTPVAVAVESKPKPKPRKPPRVRGSVLDHLPEVIERYRAGESTASIAADLGVNYCSINQALRRAGIPRRTLSESRLGRPRLDKRALTPEQEDEAIELYASGLSMRQVGDRYGISMSVIQRLLKRRDLPARPAKGAA